MRKSLLGWIVFAALTSPALSGEVAIYTGTTQWITKPLADEQAQICSDKLQALGITNTVFATDQDWDALADWVIGSTGNGEVDILVLYGDIPPSLYPDANAMPDDSVAELFIESTDGDTIINHADYMFWGLNARNSEGGLQNIMDIPGIVMWDDNTPMVVTDDGKAIAPSLVDFASDRPFHLDQLADEWVAEKILAQNEAGTRADPVIVRDGDRGRLIPALQAADQNDPKGAVAAEIIAWLLGKELAGASKLALTGSTSAYVDSPIKLTVQIQEPTGSPAPRQVASTIALASDGATGRFDTSSGGAFDGSVTSLVIPAGSTTADFYYRDSAAGARNITVTTAGLTQASLVVNVFTKSKAPAGEVALYSGTTQWISKPLADEQAQVAVDKLNDMGIVNTWYQLDTDTDALAEWVTNATGNGKLDVLVLYGDLPTALYPDGNTQPDDSVVEKFIESTDGDAVINHADYMFWGLNARNSEGGLQNIMDIPGIVMWDDNTPMTVTPEGKTIAPSLTDFLSDRPFHVDQLAGNWLVEVSLAQNPTGTRADPIIVRDGDRGRLIPALQAADQNDPKGAVASEIIAWLFGVPLSAPSKVLLSSASATLANFPVKVSFALQDDTGSPRPAQSALTLNLATDHGTGAFDTAKNGSFDGSVTSIQIPQGGITGSFYYRDSSAGTATLTASATGLDAGQVQITILEEEQVQQGEVAIYTGTTQWITKELADIQAQITIDKLDAAGITNTAFGFVEDWEALAQWVSDHTDDGKLDVLVLYGDLPSTLYPDGNAMPDGSIAETFIESTDGDAIINHADYMFWGVGPRNSEGGLQNMMDIPTILMWDDNTPMTVTAEGAEIAPSLVDFLSDRPFHVDELANEWFLEAALAQNPSGTRADPAIVRDGNRGRLIPALQAADQDDPKGAVAAEIIEWLMSKTTGGPGEPVFHRGDADNNGQLQLTDAIRILGVLFLGQGSISCDDAADADDNGQIQLTDAIRILGVLFLGQGSIPAPGPTADPCGEDPTADALGCGTYTNC